MNSHALLYVVVIPIAWLAIRPIRAERPRQILLLFVSYLLYSSWGIGFLGLLILSSLMNYFFTRSLNARQSAARLWIGIIANVALLSLFKYVPEFSPLLGSTQLGSVIDHIVLPIGMSFWTFQGMSSLFDSYRGEPLNPSFVEFLLYMAFWPTVLSGPICRLPGLLPQFRSTKNGGRRDVEKGMDRICTGLFMVALGVVLANGLHGQGVDHGFQISPKGLTGPDVWCLAFGYGFELFFNFAGYSHIVIGAARLFGFELDENFNGPYFSKTPSEFWTRWHMSLSFWIRDYLFLPLVMLNRSKLWRNATLVIAMLTFGIWHEGTVLLALWGLYHGILLVLHRQWQELKRSLGWRFSGRLPSLLSWVVTICVMCLGWVFFRSTNLKQAMTMLRSVIEITSYSKVMLPHSLFLLVAVLVAGYLGVVGLIRLGAVRLHGIQIPVEVRMVLYSVAIYLGTLHAAQTQAFAYFKF